MLADPRETLAEPREEPRWRKDGADARLAEGVDRGAGLTAAEDGRLLGEIERAAG